MNLFKKRFLELEKKYKEKLDYCEKMHNDAHKRDREVLGELLFAKSELEQENATMKLKLKDYQDIKIQCDKLTKRNIELERKNEGLISSKKVVTGSLGGLKSHNNRILEEIGEMKLENKILKEKMKKYGISELNTKDLISYEITHKSPYKKRIKSEERDYANNECKN